MLVLSRGQGEWIRIGDNIRIQIVRTGPKVRVGIEAPKEMIILREELIDVQENPPTPVPV